MTWPGRNLFLNNFYYACRTSRDLSLQRSVRKHLYWFMQWWRVQTYYWKQNIIHTMFVKPVVVRVGTGRGLSRLHHQRVFVLCINLYCTLFKIIYSKQISPVLIRELINKTCPQINRKFSCNQTSIKYTYIYVCKKVVNQPGSADLITPQIACTLLHLW